MIQQINLYTKLDWAGTSRAVFPYMAGVWLLLLLGYAVYAGIELYTQQKQLVLAEKITVANEAVRRRIAEKPVINYAAEIQNSNTLVELATKERIAKTKFVELLAQGEKGSHIQFSEFLSGLAFQHVQGVAIEKVSYRGGASGTPAEFVMAGTASTADRVPIYLEQLGHAPAYKGMVFKKVQLAELDQRVSFQVTSWTDRQDD